MNRNSSFIGISLVIILFFIPLTGIVAATFYVSPEGADTEDGLSWQTPLYSIQNAIDLAVDGDEVWVKAGEYFLTDGIVIGQDISLYGGFAGTESDPGEREWQTNISVINGQSQVDHCIKVLADALLDGFTITGGYSDGTTTELFGGGYIALGVSPVVRNCHFTDNYAELGGGGLDTWICTPLIENCIFSLNNSTSGGAVRMRDSSPVFNNCVFRDNNLDNQVGRGAGIYGWNSQITLNQCLFENNLTEAGGGVSLIDGSLTITDCDFLGNRGTTVGGAVMVRNADTVIEDCTFSGNSSYLGGVISFSGPDVTLEIMHSLFLGNTSNSGGVLALDNTGAMVMNNLFAGNRAAKLGGVVYAVTSQLYMVNCTLTENAAERGGAIFADNLAVVSIYNSILWNNECTSTISSYIPFNEFYSVVDFSTHDLHYSLIDQDGLAGEGLLNADPLFMQPGSLDINGTPYDLTDDTWVRGDYHVPEYSVAVNSGSYIMAGIDDLEYNPRPLGSDYDLGAYEFPQPDLTPPGIALVEIAIDSVSITFNEIPGPGATGPAHYSLDPGMSIYNILLSGNSRTVVLETSPHNPGTYTLDVTDIPDMNGNFLEHQTISYCLDEYGNIIPLGEIPVQRAYDPAISYYTLHIQSTNGSVVVNPDMTHYISNTPVELLALPGEGYQFDGWEGDSASTLNPLILIMDSSKTITPHFSLLPDTTVPSLVDFVQVLTSINLTFNEELDPLSVNNPLNYSIDQGIQVVEAYLMGDNQTIHLTTSYHTTGNYTLTLEGVADVSGNIIPLTTVPYNYQPFNPAGLEAYWDFNESDGAYTYDKSAYRNTGLLMNGASRADGMSGNALLLDGIDDYVDFGYSNYHLDSRISLACWINPSQIGGQLRTILIKGPYISPFMLRLTAAGTIETCLRTDTTHYALGGAILQPNTWYHLALTYDGDSQDLYLNGQLISSTPLSGAMLVDPTRNTTVGATPIGTSLFAGMIDEIAIFSRDLSPVEVGKLYYGEIIGEQDAIPGSEKNYYTLDLGGVHGLATANPQLTRYIENTTVQLTAEPSDSMYEFDHWEGSLTGSEYPGALVMDSNKAVSAIFRVANRFIPPYPVDIYALQDAVIITFNEEINPASVIDLTHYEILPEISVSEARLLEDGKTIQLSTSPHVDGSYTLGLSGIMDTYDNIMDPVILNYNYEPFDPANLEAYWDFNEPDGVYAYDKSAYRQTGLLMNGAGRGPGMNGNALLLDGIDDYVDFGYGNYNLDSRISLACWINPTQITGSTRNILIKGPYNSPFMLRLTSTGAIESCLRTDNTYYAVSKIILQTNTWYHLAVIYDGDSQDIYLNGRIISSTPLSGALLVDPGRNTTAGLTPLGTFPFKGLIDEIAIFSRDLSPGEVGKLYYGETIAEQEAIPGEEQEYYTLDLGGVDGLAIANPQLSQYLEGTTVQLTAEPGDIMYEFDHWEGSLTGSEYPATLVMDGNKTVNAIFRVANSFIPPYPLDIYAVKDALIITFSEDIDPVSIADLAHYNILPEITIINAQLLEDGKTIRLSTTPHTNGSYTLDLSGIMDTYGNTMDPVILSYMYQPFNPANLEAYWDFNEPDGVYAYDKSAYRRTGLLMNGASRGAGVNGNALLLDGTDDYVDFGYSNYNLDSRISLACWINPSQITGNTRNILIKGPYNSPFMLRLTSSGTIESCLRTDTTHYAVSKEALQTNTWYHLAVIYDGDSQDMYLNGRLISSIPLSGALLVDPSRNTTVGLTPLGIYPFEGLIDEMSIFSRDLSPGEVGKLYSGETIQEQPAAPEGGNEYYTLDLGGTHGLAIADPQLDQYLEGTTVQLTAEASDSMYEFDHWEGSLTGSEYPGTLIMDSNKSVNAIFRVSDSYIIPAPISMTAVREAIFIMFNHTLDPVSVTDLTHYSLAPEITIIDAFLMEDEMTIQLTTIPHTTGDYSLGLTGITDTNGSTMEPVVMNYHYQPIDTTNLEAYWDFNESGDDYVFDKSSYELTGLLVNGTVREPGISNNGLRFDGIDDYVDFGYSNFHLAGGLTISCWVNPALITGSYQDILMKGAYNNPFVVRIAGNGSVQTCLRTTGFNYLNTTTRLEQGNWYHVAVTYNGIEQIIYINGQVAASAPVSGDLVPDANRNTVAGLSPLGTEAFSGSLDELSIFSRALGREEIYQLYLEKSILE